MHAALKGCLLLLLWGCDWVTDPYFGTCPWSQSWGNQEVVCHSAGYRAELSRASTPASPLHSPGLAVVADWHCASPVARPGWEAPFPLPGPRLIYLFMILRR
jgi:hypothetical protein